MAGITGQGTTFNLPNFVGELFSVGRQDSPFLSAIGGLTGGQRADGVLFQWQQYDLRDPAANRNRLEGANAQTAVARVRANVTNVVEIHQETVETSYSKQGATGQFNSTGSAHPGAVGLAGANPVQNEQAWQIEQELKQMARDINHAFINGQFANPSTNGDPRATRGILQAITTNVIAAGGVDLDDPDSDFILDLMQSVWDNGGIREGETRTLLTNSTQKRRVTSYWEARGQDTPRDRNIAGVNVTSVETDFGILNILLEPSMPQDEIAVVSLEECAPMFLEIPNKGYLFVEPLAKVGAADRDQLYAEAGLKYGIENHHGKITGLGVGAS